MDDIRVVYISIPRDEADAFARSIVEERLAACVNIVPKIESYYWWDGTVNHDNEALLIVKTTAKKFPELKEYVQENHPYELPELIALPLIDGLAEYVAWVREETK
jgi:periplasmic divalent cation tolerance protein